jgi:hypothetical protein
MNNENSFVKCKFCGKDISKDDNRCPQCGKRQNGLSSIKLIGIFLAGFIIIIIVIINLPYSTKQEKNDKPNEVVIPKTCEITWILVTTKYLPSTFWTWDTGGYYWNLGTVRSAGVNDIDIKKKELSEEAIKKVSQEKKGDVTFKVENMNYIITTTTEPECKEDLIESKMGKILNYAYVTMQSREEINHLYISDVENFIKEYHE